MAQVAAAAQSQSLAQEVPYAAGVAQKKQTNKKKITQLDEMKGTNKNP